MNRREFSQLLTATALGHSFLGADAQPMKAASEVRFSVMLWTLEKIAPLERCMELVAAAGYQGVELVGEFQRWSPEDVRRIRARMRSLGLVFDSMSGVAAGFADPNGTAELMRQMTAQIAAAKQLECPQVILLSGKRDDAISRKEQHQTCIENLKRVAELAARNDIQVVIEPIDPLENPTIYLTTVSEGFEIVRAVGSPNLKVLYDFYHEQRAYGDLLDKLENNMEWVGLVHVADVPGRHEPGTGEIDFTNIYRKLAELKYNKFVAMEYYPTADPVESLRASRLAALEAWRTKAV
ncbi:MAG TPA: TIM barrel protein [Granulicella sp.]|jgi:hydroxypyruvate isomerase|nr:TIM barrel protein [Granulicella sp.]